MIIGFDSRIIELTKNRENLGKGWSAHLKGRVLNTNCILKVRIYLEGKFFEIKAENVDIALVTASLPDCAKQTGLSNEDIWKFFSKITVIIDYNLYYRFTVRFF